MALRAALFLLALLAVACGGDPSPVAPTRVPEPAPIPVPTPPTVAVRGTITDTVTGAALGLLERSVARLPARLEVASPGHVTRSAWVTSPTQRIDLFPEQGFDLRFYRQLTRDDLDKGAGAPQPLWILPSAPAFYMEVEGDKGMSRQLAARLEQVARRVVPLITGGRFQVTRWETGPTPRPRQPGWIVVERKDDTAVCGRAYIGAVDGSITLGLNTGNIDSCFAHELGHAFGFYHTDRSGALMHQRALSTDPVDIERHHMALAYARARGNRDIDVDPDGISTLTARVVVD